VKTLAACGLGLLLLQVPFEDAVRALASPEAGDRLRAVRLLREAAYPEAALPLVPLIADPEDAIQNEAIAAELNIFLGEPVATRRRVGLIVEVRAKVAAEAAFAAGPLALGPNAVPVPVIAALRAAARDTHPSVALEALYAFGVLAVEPAGAVRRDLLRESAPELAPLLGLPDAAFRASALQVIGRVFARRAGDGPVDQTMGDAVIVALNDNDRRVRLAAMDALGTMRYERAVQALVDQYQFYGRGDLAEAALAALARIGHRAASPLMSAALTTRSRPVKQVGIEGLARMGDAAAVTTIQAALAGDSTPELLLAAAFASAQLANGNIDEIVNAMTRTRLRDQARGYLVEIAPGRTGAFARQARDPDPSVRADVVDVLGLAGDPAALPIVEPLERDPDPRVARAAARAAARLRAAARPPA
jgi:HEAT repeat protein